MVLHKYVCEEIWAKSPFSDSKELEQINSGKAGKLKLFYSRS